MSTSRVNKEDKTTLQVPLQSKGGAARDTGTGTRATVSQFNLNTGAARQPDGGWGWMVCLTSMCVNGTVFGIINTFGILYVKMRDHYAKEDAEENANISFKTAWVGSVATGITFSMCMMSSIICDQIGIRTTGMIGGILAFIGMISSAFVEELMLLYLTYGIILGFGFAFAYAPSLVIIGHYFKRHMGLVNGLVTFGSSVFTVGLVFGLPAMLDSIGLRYTLISLSGLCLLMVLSAWTWKPVFTRENVGVSQAALSTMSMEVLQSRCNDCLGFTRKYLNVRIWRNKGYVVWAMANGFSLFGYFVPFVHLVKHVEDKLPSNDGAHLVLCLCCSSGVARLVLGKLTDYKWVNRIRLQQLAFAVMGICTLCIPFAESFAVLIVLTLIMGVCDGAFICLLGPIAFDLVGERSASQALGFLFGIFSVPMTVGPPIAGLLYDYLGNYDIAFHVAGCPPIIGALILFFVPKTKPQVPAIMSFQEFAAVSCHDIYQSRLDVEPEAIFPIAVSKVTPHMITLDDIMTPKDNGEAGNAEAVDKEDDDVHDAELGGLGEHSSNSSKEKEPMLPKIMITEAEDNDDDIDV